VNKKRVRELKRGTPKVTKPLINSIPQPYTLYPIPKFLTLNPKP
jgi:hypothetical protein